MQALYPITRSSNMAKGLIPRAAVLVWTVLAVFAPGLCRGQTGAPPIPASDDPCSLDAVLAVTYPTFGGDCGETVGLDVVTDGVPPSAVAFQSASQNVNYTLMMVDPDAPSATEPSRAYILHWLITNIQGDDLRTGKYTEGTEIMDYRSPNPPTSSGFHRYQFFVFSQQGLVTVNPPDSRALFDVGQFQTTHSLAGPLAGYQFRTQRTDGGTDGAAILDSNARAVMILAMGTLWNYCF